MVSTYLSCRKNLHLDHGTIDFGDNSLDLELLKKKLKQIHEYGDPELKDELLKIIDSTKNSDLGEYEKEVKFGSGTTPVKKKIDFSKFILLASTSTSNPQLSSELSEKMNPIETSCDETSIAVLENKKILSNVTISQILEQQKYGGVMPSLAAKLHVKNIQKVLQKALQEAKISPEKIDYIAYTEKPGLVICLQIGKAVAETLSLYLNKPLFPINHLEGHVYASEKLDDAIGECLDKSAILLGYNYPGGPIIEKLALSGEKNYKLPLPKNDKSLDFSFSGLKSEISRLVNSEKKNLNVNNLACSLQHTLAEILTKKLKRAWLITHAKTIIIGGGVIANYFLRNYLTREIKKWDKNIDIFIPNIKYSTDNAAMIGGKKFVIWFIRRKNQLNLNHDSATESTLEIVKSGFEVWSNDMGDGVNGKIALTAPIFLIDGGASRKVSNINRVIITGPTPILTTFYRLVLLKLNNRNGFQLIINKNLNQASDY
nr:12632_t:CDS:2 [Entrophospora candida]